MHRDFFRQLCIYEQEGVFSAPRVWWMLPRPHSAKEEGDHRTGGQLRALALYHGTTSVGP
jgi:hypothetical protein